MYRLIIYQNYGEADTRCLNIELLGYDEKGALQDALLLDNRYGYEDVECFTQFEIDTEALSIDYYVTYIVYVDDDGNLGEPVPNPEPELFRKERYCFKNGRFVLVNAWETEPQSWRRP